MAGERAGDVTAEPERIEVGRCCLCFTKGPLIRSANGERLCNDSQACIARVERMIRVR